MKEPCESWTAWSIDILVKKPLTWSFSKVKSYVVNNEINKETRYINLQIIKEFGDILFSILEKRKDNILISFSELIKCYRSEIDQNISDNTVMLILMWLRREKKIVLKSSENENELLIKIAAHSSDGITEIEEGLYKLIKQENGLIKEIELMEKEKINIINEAKSYLIKGLRQVAKTYLRKKKELEKSIENRIQTLDNIQSLITSIQTTNTNNAVLSAYKTGSHVLKKLNESGLSESNVKNIMDDLAEVSRNYTIIYFILQYLYYCKLQAIEDQKDVQVMLSESLVNDSNVDLEEELAELMKYDENIFPPVPNTELSFNVDELQKELQNLSVEGKIFIFCYK